MARLAPILLLFVCCCGGAALAIHVACALEEGSQAALPVDNLPAPPAATADGLPSHGCRHQHDLKTSADLQNCELHVVARTLPPDEPCRSPDVSALVVDPDITPAAARCNSETTGRRSKSGAVVQPAGNDFESSAANGGPSRRPLQSATLAEPERFPLTSIDLPERRGGLHPLPEPEELNSQENPSTDRNIDRVQSLPQDPQVRLTLHRESQSAADAPGHNPHLLASANMAQVLEPLPPVQREQYDSAPPAGPNPIDGAAAPPGLASPVLPPSVLPPSLPAESLRMRRSDDPAKASPAAPVIGHDERVDIYARNEDLRDVLTMLGEQAGVNIVATRSVVGQVSVALNQVTVDTALQAILRSTGYISQRDENFIYVGTPADFLEIEQAHDAIATRIFRPNYISAAELKVLITPLLTPTIGRISVSTPAKIGIAPNDNEAGGDNLAEGDALLIQDRVTVLAEIEQVVRELDRRPMQVAIEAMILSVLLDDKHECGVDFDFLRNSGTIRLGWGASLASLDGVSSESGGLKFAFLDSHMGSFIKALETIGDTSVIASPRVLVLNKQRAEILIGGQLGYVNTTVTETTATQSVEFLEVGTQLRLRPFISPDGLIRMEVHPELSTGRVRVEEGFTLPDKEVTKVTSNVMVRDGCTVIIGGLMREDLKSETKQVPLLGSLPLFGKLFRTTAEETQRREIVVLLTPRIVYEPEVNIEGDQAACEFHRRHETKADHMSHFSRNFLGEKYYRLARQAWQQGDRERAWRYIQLSISINPSDRAAIELRANMAAGASADGGMQGAMGMPAEVIAPEDVPSGAATHPLDQQQVPSWLLNDLIDQHRPVTMPHPRDPGVPGYSRPIMRPGREP